MHPRSVPQVPFVASLRDEPRTSEVVVVLFALPPVGAAFYARKSNLADWRGKSAAVQAYIEGVYGFLGGDQAELTAYHQRAYLPRYMWVYDQRHDCLLYTSPSPRDATLSRMPSSA